MINMHNYLCFLKGGYQSSNDSPYINMWQYVRTESGLQFKQVEAERKKKREGHKHSICTTQAK